MCIWASLYSWSYTLVALFFTPWLCQINIDHIPSHGLPFCAMVNQICSNGICKQRLAQHLLKSQFFRIKTLSLMNQLIKPALARPYRGKTDVHIQGWPVQKKGRKVPGFRPQKPTIDRGPGPRCVRALIGPHHDQSLVSGRSWTWWAGWWVYFDNFNQNFGIDPSINQMWRENPQQTIVFGKFLGVWSLKSKGLSGCACFWGLLHLYTTNWNFIQSTVRHLWRGRF